MGWRILLRDLGVYWRSLVLIFTPILLLFIPLHFGPTTGHEKEMWCLYVMITMAVWWAVEALPLAVTAFVPIFAFPLVGSIGVKQVCMAYLKDTNFLFFGGLVVAVAVEESGLHKRIALRVLVSVGSKPRWLMLGFMGVTAFLSMWMSNTATTAMMVPIAVAVLEEMIVSQRRMAAAQLTGNNAPITATELSHITRDSKAVLVTAGSVDSQDIESESLSLGLDIKPGESVVTCPDLTPRERGICRGILLSICYSANIGGTGTLTGTGPNLIFRNALSELAGGGKTPISFASWMPFGISCMLLSLIISWLWLQICFFGLRDTFSCKTSQEAKHSEERVNELLKRQYLGLGGITFAEVWMIIWWFVLVLLWIFRSPSGISGWEDAFDPKLLSDACAAMGVAFILFAWPNRMPDFYCLREDRSSVAEARGALMSWDAMKRRFPWSVIVLLGGGFAVAAAVKNSGLSAFLASRIGAALSGLHSFWISAIFTALITFVTEVTS